MVDVLGGTAIIVSIIYAVSVSVAYRWRPNSTGLMIGVLFASLVFFFGKNQIWGLAQAMV